LERSLQGFSRRIAGNSGISSASSKRAEGPAAAVNTAALARVATHTEAAPALTSARDAARAVAPVVRMSSMSRMCFIATAAGSETEKAPRTFNRRWRGVSPAWLSVARSRISVVDASVSRHSGWLLRNASSAATASERA